MEGSAVAPAESDLIPCFREGTTSSRILQQHSVLHLPVAPRCNMLCVGCDRDSDCQRRAPRGTKSRLLSPDQACRFVDSVLASGEGVAAVGVTGPGEPLANAETFVTLRRLRAAHPDLQLFVGTNGLQVVDTIQELRACGLNFSMMNVDAVSPDVGARMMQWIREDGVVLSGIQAASRLISRQLCGIEALVNEGIAVRVNVKVCAGINENHVDQIAQQVQAAGATRIALSAHGVDPLTMARIRQSVKETIAVVDSCRRCSNDTQGCKAHFARFDKTLDFVSLTKDPMTSSAPPPSYPEHLPTDVYSHSYEQLQLLARVSMLLSSTDDAAVQALRTVLGWLQQLGLVRAVATLVDEGSDELRVVFAGDGVEPEDSEKMRYQAGEGVTGQVFSTGTSVFLPQLGASADFLDRSGLRRDEDLSKLAFFCVPIRTSHSVIGTLSADKANSNLKDAEGELALLEKIARLIAPFVQRKRLEENLMLFQRLRSSDRRFDGLVGRSRAMEEVRRLVATVAATSTSVLVTGDTGTGKGVVARTIADLSPRALKPFIDVNCGAMPENLVESELFGHERGSFTGAHQRRVGVLERAEDGTVFLDEIGELSLSAQTKLLRVLQTRKFERVGGSSTLTFSARIIAATNRDLAKAVEEGTFRADLYYRLNVFPIAMPPLRERGKADVMLLTDSFIARFAKEMGKRIFRIDTPAIDMITAYHWPGNVRELENVIERAVVLAEGDVLHAYHLPPSLQMNRYAEQPSTTGDFTQLVANYEINLITEALKDENGNQTKAAERLGITKRIIQYKIKQYEIDWRRFIR